MAIAHDGSRLYVAACDRNAVAEIDLCGEQPIAHGRGAVRDRPGNDAAATAHIEQGEFQIEAAAGRICSVVQAALIGEGGALGVNVPNF